ncbi:uncharacterized protein HD556DRAFT_4491 [Suillus plorans]|uniref:Uncharacterized protein n=1 Tax=Suillus plorans TaxID=116603 RepID=A0A9P7J9K7_9AGAM|nr:uncharacterized protein HD556DRAFT_4491 [Suillus plorans]KAG1809794.1 hypothetical protein HD556DRAFT_4491 [Suillus plorans]
MSKYYPQEIDQSPHDIYLRPLRPEDLINCCHAKLAWRCAGTERCLINLIKALLVLDLSSTSNTFTPTTSLYISSSIATIESPSHPIEIRVGCRQDANSFPQLFFKEDGPIVTLGQSGKSVPKGLLCATEAKRPCNIRTCPRSSVSSIHSGRCIEHALSVCFVPLDGISDDEVPDSVFPQAIDFFFKWTGIPSVLCTLSFDSNLVRIAS